MQKIDFMNSDVCGWHYFHKSLTTVHGVVTSFGFVYLGNHVHDIEYHHTVSIFIW